MKKTAKQQYWSVFWYGSSRTICSVHHTLQAAQRAARKCEAAGGAKHTILLVKEVA